MNGIKEKVKLKKVARGQSKFEVVNYEDDLPIDDPVRAIWEFTGYLDLDKFYKEIKTMKHDVGTTRNDPRILIALWIYAYSDGINSGREISRLTKKELPYKWLCGGEEINYHTISDFRKDHKEELDEIFKMSLGILSNEGLITLKRVTQDGTKIKASAGVDTFKGEEKLKEHLKIAKEQVELLSSPDEEDKITKRIEGAKIRAAKDREERLKKAIDELEKLKKTKSEKEAKKIRVSETDPESRIMKQSNGGYNPSYNAQFAVDEENKIIIGKDVINISSDYGALEPMIEEIKNNTGDYPDQMLTDGGYITRNNIVKTGDKKIDLIGPELEESKASERSYKIRNVDINFTGDKFEYNKKENILICPAGKILIYNGREKEVGLTRHKYRADIKDCGCCKYKNLCCPENTQGRAVIRNENSPAVLNYKEKVKKAKIKEIYKKRGEIAEFPNLWIKCKFNLRQFMLRGLEKVKTEITIAAIAYNIKQWIRLIWIPKLRLSSS